MKKFNVLVWDFNSDELKHYDVLPYFRQEIADPRNRGAVHDKEDLRKLIEKESRWMFWSRCEWEMICHGWPVRKNDYKLDVHEQVMMNIDTIVEILWNEINKK